MENFILFGFSEAVYRTFCDEKVRPKVWVKTGREKEIHNDNGTQIINHSPLKFTEVDAIFCKDLPADMATRVRKQAMPHYIRNINRSQRSRADRNHTWLHTHNRLEMMIHWYYRLIKEHNIDTIIWDNIPHGGSTIALYYLAEELKIRNIFCYQSVFNSFFIIRDFKDIGLFKTSIPRAENPLMSVNTEPKTPYYMKQKNDIQTNIIQICTKYIELIYNRIEVKFGKKDKIRVRKREIAILKDRLKMLKLLKKYPTNIKLEKNFVYYPLHFQPELTIDGLGDLYADNLLLVEELRRKLPDDVHIYVKENPKQTLYGREPSFFKRLEAIPHTSYLHPAINTYDLIKKCRAVATQTGSAGWEALQMGKPVLLFGYGWYRSLPGVFHWSENPDWEAVNHFSFNENKLRSSVKKLSRHFLPGLSQTKGYSSIVQDFDPDKNGQQVAQEILRYVRDLEKQA